MYVVGTYIFFYQIIFKYHIMRIVIPTNIMYYVRHPIVSVGIKNRKSELPGKYQTKK